MNSPNIDMAKVREAVHAIELRQAAMRPRTREYPVKPPAQPAQDAALRKPLTSRGRPCRGFSHPHFLNRD